MENGTSDEESEDEAQVRAELNRARRIAYQRMDRHEAHEQDRAFAVLDNVSERECPSWREVGKMKRAKLDPSLNPHIDFEAVEVGDSDSDLQHDDRDSFIASDGSIISDSHTENRSPPKENKTVGANPDSLQRVELEWEEHSSGATGEPECTLYEEFVASRKVVEAQIAAEERKRKRYMFCDSTDEEDEDVEDGNSKLSRAEAEEEASNSDHSRAEAEEEASNSDHSRAEAEEEASFSSVVGTGAKHEDETC